MNNTKLDRKGHIAVFAVLTLLLSTTLVAFLPFDDNSTQAAGADLDPWDGNVATGFAGGAGTFGDPYRIDNASQLAYLAQQINQGIGNTDQIHYKLTNDILLNDLTLVNVWGEGLSPRNPWTPIGTQTNPFSAHFDGDGFVIFGIYINTASDYQGLFGYVGQGGISNVIENVIVENSRIGGGSNVGSIAGYVYSTTDVKNSYSTAKVQGTNNVGGLIGYLAGGDVSDSFNKGSVSGTGTAVGGIAGLSSGNISGSYNEGMISGASSVGGIAGNSTGGIFSNCYNEGSVSSTGNGAGGIAGTSSMTVANSYNSGQVYGTSNIGGIIGNATGGSLSNTYNSGSISGATNVGSLLGSRGTASLSNGYALSDGTLIVGSGSTAGGQYFSDLGYLMSGSVVTTTTLISILNANRGTNAEWIGAPYPTISIYSGYVSGVWSGGQSDYNGAGTYSDPYRIRNAEQLAKFAAYVNAGNTTYNSEYAHYRLTGHIVLNNTTGWENWGTSGPANSWTPIGTNSNFFVSVFDGMGFTVQGVYINNSSDRQGLFGAMGYPGSIEDLGVVKSYIKGNDQVGGITGAAGVLIGCYNAGTVVGNNNVGGLVGASGGTIISCFNVGTIIGGNRTGGIAGSVSGFSLVSNSHNTGSVSGVNSVGGVAGIAESSDPNNTPAITHSFNIGSVSSTSPDSNSIGGVAGNLSDYSTTTYCYNTGNISGNGFVGGVAGYVRGKLTDSYNTGSVSGRSDPSGNYNSNIGGLVGSAEYGSGTSFIANCYNTGAVNNAAASQAGSNHYINTGGIAGNVYGLSMSNCYNSGQVTAAYGTPGAIFGIVGGDATHDGTIVNCYASDAASANLGGYVNTYGSTLRCSFYGASSGTLQTPVAVVNGGTVYSTLRTVLPAWVANNGGDYAVWSADTIPSLKVDARLLDGIWDGTAADWIPASKAFSGTRDSRNPFRIRYAFQLALLAELANAGNLDYNNNWIHYVLTDDIYLNDTYGWNGWNQSTSGLNVWTPIGTYANNDATKLALINFDGAGYTISGMYVNNPTNDYQGLFGFVSPNDLSYGATLRNISLERSFVNGHKNVGGIAGQIDGSITTSYFSGNVTGTDYNIGGITGSIGGHSSFIGRISYTYNLGNVTGSAISRNVGGIVGIAYLGEVRNAYNKGNITGYEENVGGITGNLIGGDIANTYNTGTINGSSSSNKNVGGIAGIVQSVTQGETEVMGSLRNSYNTGGVQGITNVGGAVGILESGNTVEYCYTIGPLSPVGTGTGTQCYQFDSAYSIIGGPVIIAGNEALDLGTALNYWVAINSYNTLYFISGPADIPFIFSEKATMYTIELTVAGNTGGTVGPSGFFYVLDNTTTTVTFTPLPGYKLISVFDGDTQIYPTENNGVWEYTLTVTESHVMTATFAVDQDQTFKVDVNISGLGTVSPDTEVELYVGQQQSYTVTPTPGWKVASVVFNGQTITGSGGVYTISGVGWDSTLFVEFEIDPDYTFSVSGTVTANDGHMDFVVSYTVNGGSAQTVNTNASGEYTITGITYGSEIVITVTTAGYTYAPVQITRTITADEINLDFTATRIITHTVGGTITPDVGDKQGFTVSFAGQTTTTDVNGNYVLTIPDGSSGILRASKTGYSDATTVITNVTTDITENLNISILTFTVQQTHDPQISDLEYSVDDGQNWDPMPASVTLSYGTVVLFKFNTPAGYRSSVNVTGATATEDGGIWKFTLQDDVSVTISASAFFYVDAQVSGGHGVVTPAYTEVSPGGSVTLTFDPNEGYKVAYITINGQRIDVNTSTYTIYNITENMTIEVHFEKSSSSGGENQIISILWILVLIVILAFIGYLIYRSR